MAVEPAESRTGTAKNMSLADLARQVYETPTLLLAADQPLPPAVSALEIQQGSLFEGWTVGDAFAVECLVSRFRPSSFATIAVLGSARLAEHLRPWFADIQTDAPSSGLDYLLWTSASPDVEPGFLESWLDRLRPGGVILAVFGEQEIAGSAPWQLAEKLHKLGLAGGGVLLRGNTKGISHRHGAVVVGRRPRKTAPLAKPTRAPVSVIIPVYNHEHYLPETLESVFRQSLPPAEVIVIDDGSKDNSAAVAAELCSGFPGAVFWSHTNRGAHNTINAGLHRSTQPLVTILNSDDRYRADRIRRCTALFDRSDVHFVATDLSFIDDDGKAIENPWFVEALSFWREIGNSSLALLNGNFIMTTSNFMVRRTAFDEIGMFHNFRYAHDLDFFLRLLRSGRKLTFVEEKLVDYRIHANNTIKEAHVRVRAEVAYLFASVLFSCPDGLFEEMTLASFMRQFDTVVRKHGLGACISAVVERVHRLRLQGVDCYDALTADPDFFKQFLEICS